MLKKFFYHHFVRLYSCFHIRGEIIFFRSIAFTCFCSCLFFKAQGALPPQVPQRIKHYYGPKLTENRTENFKENLHKILDSYHIPQKNDFDRLTSRCPSSINCYSHRDLGYSEARRYLFGYLHLEQNKYQRYFVVTSYCQEAISNKDLPKDASLGPMQIPSPKLLNTEHSWPQSRFTSHFSKSMQKSDLHALYPVKMTVNSTRRNVPYGKVIEVRSQACDSASLGRNPTGQTVFEPSDQIKGNIARSLFYFSTRYKVSIDAEEESHLRQWHQLDPVDEEEALRNDEIFEIQQVRNPYIDYPEWVDKIANF